jgi:hypothetical protein
MNLKNWLSLISIGFEDGPAIMEFVHELNTNPTCIKGIKAVERALHQYHERTAAPGPVIDYKPEPPASPVELHTIATAIQQHAVQSFQAQTGGPPQAAGNPDADAPGGSRGVSI